MKHNEEVDNLAFNYAIQEAPKKDMVIIRLLEQAYKVGYDKGSKSKDSSRTD